MFTVQPDSSTAVVSLLWRASWQAAVLFAVVFVLVLFTKRLIAPRHRVFLWSVPLLRMLMLVVPVSSISLFNAAGSLPLTADTVNSDTFRQLRESANIHGRSAHVQTDGADRLLNTTDSIALAVRPSVASELPNNSRWNLWTIALAVWMTGIAIALARWVAGFAQLCVIIRQSRPIQEVRDLDQQLRQLLSRRRRCPRILVTEAELGPASAGIVRPVILIPIRLAKGLDSEEIAAVIHHEWQHIRRYDAIFLGLARLAVIIHWFNPLVYLNKAILRREIELAVDSATISGLGDAQRQTYGRLLLQLASSSDNQFGLAQMASRRSKIRSRIEAIAKPQRSGWLRSTIAVLAIVGFMFTGLSDRVETQEQKPAAQTQELATEKYAIAGQVIDKQSGKRIASAKVQFLVDTEQDPDKRVRIGETDENGNYRIEVPMGAVKLWFPELKPGYWLPSDEAMVGVTTSPEQPEASLRIYANSGPVWKVRAIGEVGDTPILSAMEESDAEKRAAMLRGEPVQWQVSPTQAFSYLDSDGYGALTQVGSSGGLLVGVVNVKGEIVADPDFDNTQVVELKPMPGEGSTTLIDRNGKEAMVSNAIVTLNDGVPLLTYKLKPIAPAVTQKLTGRLVDKNGSPVSGARIGVAAGQKEAGSAVWPFETNTNADGRFTLDVAVPSHFNAADNDTVVQFAVTINKDGLASRDTDYIDADADFSPIDFGTVQLSTGFSMPVLVRDSNGQPVAGAAVEPQSDYALRRQAARTNSSGKAILKNIPAGLLRVTVYHGDQYASATLVVSDDPQDNTVATIRISKLQPQLDQPKPVAVGDAAPDLEVGGWSDGKTRELADYRGKVVVLDFWGLWCAPCIHAVPAMKTLAEKYENKGVVFLGIHTADGDVGQINKLKKSMGWNTPSGLDLGTSITDGKTCLAYGIRGYPSVVIIDAQGKIAFNGSIEPKSREAMMRDMEKLAKANAIPWPPTERSEEDNKEAITRLQIARFSREIERVLKDALGSEQGL
jgi:beta-lactamase regulating signal transducer with metallopeptidase domain/thiol-disulfide isomerase/thioredoxin